MTDHAYSTDDPAALAAYRQAVAERKAWADKLRADVTEMGLDPDEVRVSSAFGSENIYGLPLNGDHIPEGWRKVRGRLEPRIGKAGEAARAWLKASQPVNIRAALAPHGLVQCAFTDYGYVLVPAVFEHGGRLWAFYSGDPNSRDGREKVTWPEVKLSEFYAAKEAHDAAQSSEATA